MFKKYRDVFCGVFLIAIAAILYILSFNIKSVAINLIKADFFPRLDAGILAILGIILVITGLIGARSYVPGPEPDPETKALNRDATISMVETLGLTAIYIFCLKPVGFVISTFVYLVLQMIVLTPKEKRKPKLIILFVAISAICAVGIYLVFVKLFYLMLPAGLLRF